MIQAIKVLLKSWLIKWAQREIDKLERKLEKKKKSLVKKTVTHDQETEYFDDDHY